MVLKAKVEPGTSKVYLIKQLVSVLKRVYESVCMCVFVCLCVYIRGQSSSSLLSSHAVQPSHCQAIGIHCIFPLRQANCPGLQRSSTYTHTDTYIYTYEKHTNNTCCTQHTAPYRHHESLHPPSHQHTKTDPGISTLYKQAVGCVWGEWMCRGEGGVGVPESSRATANRRPAGENKTLVN